MQSTNGALRKFNNFLTLLVVLLGLYIFVTPFMPRAQLYVAQALDSTEGYVYNNNFQPSAPAAKPIPSDNRLVIPSAQIDLPILEGRSIAVINNSGSWRRPASSTPDEGGNTVIIGHRYTYQGTPGFYNLDKVKLGDAIISYWKGKEYDYRVREIKTVTPTTVSVEQQTDEKLLTLYTCTPVWNGKYRLVIIAEPFTP